jgi:hypothetical protein
MGIVAVGTGLGALSGYAVGKSSARRGPEEGKRAARDRSGMLGHRYHYTVINETDDPVSFRWYNELDIERFWKQLGARAPIELRPHTRQTFATFDAQVVVDVIDLLTRELHSWRLSGTANNELVLSND